MSIYRIKTETHNGRTYQIEFGYDEMMLPPWEEHDGHGPVSEWTHRSKRPSERVLCETKGHKRYYDFAEAVKIAKKDRWNTAPYTFATKGQQAVAAVESDFRYLKAWCDNEWWYAFICVTLLDNDGDQTVVYATLGGVEDGYYGDIQDAHHADLILGLVADCEAQLKNVIANKIKTLKALVA